MYTPKTLVAVVLCWLLAPALAWPIFPWGSPTPIPEIKHAALASASASAVIAPKDFAASASPHDTTPEDSPSFARASFAIQPPFRLDDAQQALSMPPRRDAKRSWASRSRTPASREARLLALMRRTSA